MSTDPSTRNVTAAYRLASTDDRVEGRSWYATARAVAESLDPDDPARAAAVIAVLSPRLSWRKNVEAARDAYAGRELRVLSANARGRLERTLRETRRGVALYGAGA